MASNGGAGDGSGNGETTNEAGDDEPDPDAAPVGGDAAAGGLARLVDGLRSGDLAFVFTVVARVGAAIAAHPGAPAGASDRFVQDVALALADLAAAPAAADRAATDLLGDAIRACHTPSADCGPVTFAAPDGRRPDERSA